MNIAIVCYPTYGGSGVLATELGKALAEKGHNIHFITYQQPVDRGTVLMHYGNNTMPSGTTINVTSVTISADIGSPVKAVFDGIVSTVQTVEDMQVVIIQHGRYFSTYSNLAGVNIQRGQQIKTGQSIGRVAANFDGIGAIDFFMSNEKSNYDPESWLRRR